MSRDGSDRVDVPSTRPIFVVLGLLGLLVVAAGTGCGLADRDDGPAADAPESSATMKFDYVGAEAIVAAIERDSLTTADVDSLLRIHGVRAMVGNVTRFFPPVGEPEFRRAIQSFARTKERSDPDRYFQLDDVWSGRRKIRSLVGQIRENEAAVLHRVRVGLAPYEPRVDSLAITVFFVAGGVSDGFVPDNTSAANFYANLARANGDFDGAVRNIVHEAYHLEQKAAQRRVPGLAAVADSIESLPGAERLLATTLAEGTARYVVEPTRSYRAGRVQENFAVFDTVLAGLREGSVAWDAAYARGFTNAEDERFYVLGHEMAKTVDRYCGRACIGHSFEVQPIEFFRAYVHLYREHPDIVGRFAPTTEAFLTGGASPPRP